MDPFEACDINNWYQTFKPHTLKTALIPLPHTFTTYLSQPSMVIPGAPTPQGEYQILSETDSEASFDDEIEAPSFPLLDLEIKKAVEELRGVFPKLNWSSPKDAVWIAYSGTLKCMAPEDVYLLLKSSDFLTHDINTAKKLSLPDTITSTDSVTGPDSASGTATDSVSRTDTVTHSATGTATDSMTTKNSKKDSEDTKTTQNEYPLVLALRQWWHINPALEFRCFVKNKKLVGVCQRDVRNYYAFLGVEGERIMNVIVTFFEKVVWKFGLDDFVFDVFCNETYHITLVDFNPFDKVTDALLFEWDELQEMDITQPPELRIIRSEGETKHGNEAAFSHNRVPKEMFDFSADAGGMAEFAKQMYEEFERAGKDFGVSE